MQNLLISIYNVMMNVSFSKSFLSKKKEKKKLCRIHKSTAACEIRSALPSSFTLISLTPAKAHVHSPALLIAVPWADHSHHVIFIECLSKEAALPDS